MKNVDEATLLAIIRQAVAEAGSQSAFARNHGINQSDINKALKGVIRLAGGPVTAAGYRRVLLQTYVPIDEDFTPPPGYDDVTPKVHR